MKLPIGKIVCGDCVKVAQKWPDECIDLIVTSPPYDNLRTYGGCRFDFESVSKALVRILKQDGIIVWVVGDATIKGGETGTSFKQALHFKELGLNLHDTMVYAKRGFQMPSIKEHKRYHQMFEFMFVFSKGVPKTFNPIRDRKNLHPNYLQKSPGAKRQKNGTLKKSTPYTIEYYGKRGNVWSYSPGGGKSSKLRFSFEHPAIFPESLARDHIISWSNSEDIVLDPMVGSGTTCAMAERLSRKWIGIDISAKYCKIARGRIAYEKQHPGFKIFK